MKVVIIGSGNVATVLGKVILAAGHEIIQVAGRNAKEVVSLASILNTSYTNNLFEINLLSDIYIIAVSDLSIVTVAQQMRLNDKIVVHTGAAVSKDVLQECSENYGVLYPFQTFKKEITRTPVIPILIDAGNIITLERLKDFAAGWADTVTVIKDEERLALHLAAIFVNNFTNHLFSIAENFCDIKNLNFNLLKPLIKETIERIEESSPSLMQTGPAVRKDFGTIEKHRNLLSGTPAILQLYDELTSSIINFYDRNRK